MPPVIPVLCPVCGQVVNLISPYLPPNTKPGPSIYVHEIHRKIENFDQCPGSGKSQADAQKLVDGKGATNVHD